MAELTQYGMGGLFIAYLIYDSQKREKRANARSKIEDERNEKYLLTLEKIGSQLENLSEGHRRLESKNEKMIERVDNFIREIK